MFSSSLLQTFDVLALRVVSNWFTVYVVPFFKLMAFWLCGQFKLLHFMLSFASNVWLFSLAGSFKFVQSSCTCYALLQHVVLCGHFKLCLYFMLCPASNMWHFSLCGHFKLCLHFMLCPALNMWLLTLCGHF